MKFAFALLFFSLLAYGDEDVCRFTLNCKVEVRVFSLEFQSISGDCLADDMVGTFKAGKISKELGLKKDWYFEIANLGDVAPVCEGSNGVKYPAFKLGDQFMLVFLLSSGRPSNDVISAAVIDLSDGRLVSELEIGPTKNKSIAVLKTKNGYKLQIVKDRLKAVACECDAAFVDEWKEVRFQKNKLEARWLK